MTNGPDSRTLTQTGTEPEQASRPVQDQITAAFNMLGQVADSTRTTATTATTNAASIGALSEATNNLAAAILAIVNNQADLAAHLQALTVRQAELTAALDGHADLKDDVLKISEEIQFLADRGEPFQRVIELVKAAGALLGGIGGLGGLMS